MNRTQERMMTAFFTSLPLACFVAAAAGPQQSPAPATDARRAEAPATTQASTRPSQTAILAEECVVHRGIPYVAGGTDKQRLDVYAPSNGRGLPVLLFVHGGEWAKGDKGDVSTKPKFFNENDIVFVSINYRLSATDQHPAQVNDVAAALRWCRDHIAEYGGNPTDVTLMGHSAGCHLVSLIGLDPRPLATVGMKPADLRGIVSWSGGAFDLVQKVEEGGMYSGYIKINFGNDPSSWRDASPVRYVANAPSAPRFLFTSAGNGNPGSRTMSELMTQKIRQAGGNAETALIEGKTHFAINHEIGQEGDSSGNVLLRFIRQGSRQP